MEVVGIPSSVKDDALEDKIFNAFQEIGAEIGQRDIQACQRMKNNRTIVKFSNMKNCLQLLRVKKQLKKLDCNLFNFPTGTKILANESPYYRGLWTKCKAIKNHSKLHKFCTINGIIRTKMVEHGPVKTATYISDLEELFPDMIYRQFIDFYFVPCIRLLNPNFRLCYSY